MMTRWHVSARKYLEGRFARENLVLHAVEVVLGLCLLLLLPLLLPHGPDAANISGRRQAGGAVSKHTHGPEEHGPATGLAKGEAC